MPRRAVGHERSRMYTETLKKELQATLQRDQGRGALQGRARHRHRAAARDQGANRGRRCSTSARTTTSASRTTRSSSRRPARRCDTHGFGLSSVRFICGTQDIHKELERQIAEFFGTEDAILYSSCFDANGGLFETLLGEEDAIISDALNHASIIDGIRLCKAERYRYDNNDMADLRRGSRRRRPPARSGS